MSELFEALLSGLACGVQDGCDRGPRDVVLAGAGDGCRQLRDGAGELEMNLVEQLEGVEVSGAGQLAWAVSLAEGAASSLTGGAQRGRAVGDGRGSSQLGRSWGLRA